MLAGAERERERVWKENDSECMSAQHEKCRAQVLIVDVAWLIHYSTKLHSTSISSKRSVMEKKAEMLGSDALSISRNLKPGHFDCCPCLDVFSCHSYLHCVSTGLSLP